jgi:hypothetical protein
MYVEFSEYNDHESETWSAFVKANDPLCMRLVAVIDKAMKCDVDDDDLGLTYEKRAYTEQTVEALCERDEGGYMARYFEGSISEEELMKAEKIDFSNVNDEEVHINYKMSMFE